MKVLSLILGLLMAQLLMTYATYGGAIRLKETIAGESFKVIQAAMPEVEKRGFDLSKYRISVDEDKTIQDERTTEYYVVSFIDKNAPIVPTGLGNPGKIPGFEVTLDPNTLKIIKAHYIK